MKRILCLTAIFGFLSFDALAGQYVCPTGAHLVDRRKCSDGSLAQYQSTDLTPQKSQTIQKHQSAPVQQYRSQDIDPYQSHTAHVYTPEERRKMMENTERPAKDIAKKWDKNNKGLNQQQMNAISNQRCLEMAATNPDVRCVPR